MASVKQGIWIETVSVLWMMIEAGAAMAAGLLAHSMALVAFGADSVIEWVAGLVLLWRLVIEARGSGLDRVRRAERLSSWVVGLALWLLAVYIAIGSVVKLWTHQGAETSELGIGLAVASGIVMPCLSRAKQHVGTAIDSPALRADGACSMVCAYMAWTLLTGVVLTALFGWWWVDSLAALTLIYFIVKEGWEACEAARGKEGACGCKCEHD